MNTPQASRNHVPGAGSPAACSAGASGGSARRKRVWRIARVSLALLTLGSIGIFTAAHSGKAIAAPKTTSTHYIFNGDWYLHPGSSTDTPSYTSNYTDLMREGTTFEVICAAAGDPITPDGGLATDGPSGFPDYAWEYGTDAATGDAGWVSDEGLDTKVTQSQAQAQLAQLASQGIPTCGSDVQTPLQPATSANSLQPAIPPAGNQTLPVTSPNSEQSPATPNTNVSCFTDAASYFLGSLSQETDQVGDGSVNNWGDLFAALGTDSMQAGNNSSTILCVQASLSDPDTANHRVYVSDVAVTVPSVDPPGCNEAFMVEIWGDRFYQTTDCTTQSEWHINKWLADGTNICAALSSAYDTSYFNSQDAADAAVEAGTVQLGSADQSRSITCIPIHA